jgi:anti-sigma factor RsiW
MREEILDLLYRSFDGDLTADEQQRLEAALSSPELRREKTRLETIRKAIAASRTDSFRPFFAERVMQQIKSAAPERVEEQTFSQYLSHVFRRVVLAGAAVVIAFLIYNVAVSREISLSTALGVPEITMEEVLSPPLETILEELS